MIRYQLNMPESEWLHPTKPRATVIVSLPANERDELAELHFEGSEHWVWMVQEVLFSAGLAGDGQDIEPTTTPSEIYFAMQERAMQKFDPQLLEGGLLVVSPERLLPQLLDRIAREVVQLFTDTLPRLMAGHVPAFGRLIANFRLLTALSKEAAYVHSRAASGTRMDVHERLIDELSKADGDVEQIRGLVAEAAAYLCELDFDKFHTNGTRVSLLLGPLALLFSDTGDVELARLHAELASNCP
jgi:hypothetical protein